MPHPSLEPGCTASITQPVTANDTAVSLASGELEVLATPRLLAWMEEATVCAVTGRLADGQTSVGTRVALEHLKASAVGVELAIQATLHYVDGRLLRFEVVATQQDGAVVAHAEITRVVVDAQRFLARIPVEP